MLYNKQFDCVGSPLDVKSRPYGANPVENHLFKKKNNECKRFKSIRHFFLPASQHR